MIAVTRNMTLEDRMKYLAKAKDCITEIWEAEETFFSLLCIFKT